MKRIITVSILILCHQFCQQPVCADRPQYAYIGGYYGICEFRVKPDGSLQPLRNGPVKGGSIRAGFSLYELLIDPKTRTVYGLSMEDKIYSYAIGRTGQLSLKAVAPFTDASAEQEVVLDPQQHFLYALDSTSGLVVYDALNREHLIKKQTIKANTDLQSLLLDQKRRSLLIFAAHEGMYGKVTNERLFRYPLRHRGQALTSHLTAYSRSGIRSADTLAGRFVVGNWESTLTVHQIESNGALRPLSRQPILKAVAANTPSRIVYRRAGSFLYIGTYESTGDPHITASPSPIIVCRFSSDGHLSDQEQTGQPVPNPRPYLDNTGRFLYVVSMEGPVDAYKVGTDGRLSHSGSRLKVFIPTGMVFFGGSEK